MASDASCPICGGALVAPRPLEVCDDCGQNLDATGAVSVTTTSEFAAISPRMAPGDPSRTRARTSEGVACNWCGKLQSDVKKLLSGGGVHICNECVALCADIMLAELGDDWR